MGVFWFGILDQLQDYAIFEKSGAIGNPTGQRTIVKKSCNNPLLAHIQKKKNHDKHTPKISTGKTEIRDLYFGKFVKNGVLLDSFVIVSWSLNLLLIPIENCLIL